MATDILARCFPDVHGGPQERQGWQPLLRGQPGHAGAGPRRPGDARASQEGVGTLFALLHPRRAALPNGAARHRDLAGSARAHRKPERCLPAGLRRGLFLPSRPAPWTSKYACATARYSAGTILQFILLEGFQLDELSRYPREHEVLLPPNKRYAVSSAGPTTKTVFSPVGEDCRSMCPRSANIPRNINTSDIRQPSRRRCTSSSCVSSVMGRIIS